MPLMREAPTVSVLAEECGLNSRQQRPKGEEREQVPGGGGVPKSIDQHEQNACRGAEEQAHAPRLAGAVLTHRLPVAHLVNAKPGINIPLGPISRVKRVTNLSDSDLKYSYQFWCLYLTLIGYYWDVLVEVSHLTLML